LIALDVPFRLAFALSRSSLDRLVEQAAELPPVTQLPPQSVGLYRCGTFALGDPEQVAAMPPGVLAASVNDNSLKATWKDAQGRVWIHIVGTTQALATISLSCSNRFPYGFADGSGFVWSPDEPPPQRSGRRVRRLTDDGWYVWTYE